MAVNKTGAMFKSLTFDGEDSRDYGVYITGQAVFNAPEREVEMISIPGRNGQFALDKGRFENIEVTYPAGIFANTEADFAEAVSNFRNLLCSKRGYVRLQDEYHPDEYRMAIYKSGLELENVALKAGEFEITFDCKPQRYLASGEEENTVVNGGTLTNPTLFDAEPLLEVEGYGNIGFNGYEIEIENVELGNIDLVLDGFTITIEDGTLNVGDVLSFGRIRYQPRLYSTVGPIVDVQVTINTDGFGNTTGIGSPDIVARYVNFSFNIEPYNTTYTSGATSFSYTAVITNGSGTSYTVTGTFSMTIDTSSGTITFGHNITTAEFVPSGVLLSVKDAFAISTVSALGHPTYIDCELGEAYLIKNGIPISLNAHIDLGSDLPKLAPGGNEFTIDNTITELKVVPKWWKV